LALLDRAIVRLLPAVPKPIVHRLSARYIAGPELADACRVIAEENRQGKLATVDVLGEAVARPDEAQAFVRAYHAALEAIEREALDANVSVKPTAFGLKLGYKLAREDLEAVARDAAARANFVRIEMEDSSCTDDTFRLYRELRRRGCDNVGIVLQAYLRRTDEDIEALAELRPNVRLVKGIYVEPESVAYQDDGEIRVSFVRALEALLGAGCYVGIATHDDVLIREALRLVAGHDHEFQFLLGVRAELGNRLVREGHRVRTYVPFGQHWYEYSVRRLQENPRMAGYIAADTVFRLLRRY
jgi:proline dehydrogenase